VKSIDKASDNLVKTLNLLSDPKNGDSQIGAQLWKTERNE
jgi:hypothetical protein